MGRIFEKRKATIFKTAALKSKLYSKYGKQLYVAARNGVPDPEANPALRNLVERAKRENVPSHVIEKAIQKAAGTGGVVLRGRFSPGLSGDAREWSDRRLLARVHRYTLNRLRADIEPVTVAEFTRFLFAWQHVAPAARLTGADGLRAVVRQLEAFETAAAAWERSILLARVDRYEPGLLDALCFSG